MALSAIGWLAARASPPSADRAVPATTAAISRRETAPGRNFFMIGSASIEPGEVASPIIRTPARRYLAEPGLKKVVRNPGPGQRMEPGSSAGLVCLRAD